MSLGWTQHAQTQVATWRTGQDLQESPLAGLMKARVGEYMGFLRLYHKLGGLTNRNLLCHSSGSYKSESKALAELVFLRVVGEDMSRPLSEPLVVCWHCPNLCLHLHVVFSICMCLSPNPPLL